VEEKSMKLYVLFYTEKEGKPNLPTAAVLEAPDAEKAKARLKLFDIIGCYEVSGVISQNVVSTVKADRAVTVTKDAG
jgi:hypothetical protein